MDECEFINECLESGLKTCCNPDTTRDFVKGCPDRKLAILVLKNFTIVEGTIREFTAGEP